VARSDERGGPGPAVPSDRVFTLTGKAGDEGRLGWAGRQGGAEFRLPMAVFRWHLTRGERYSRGFGGAGRSPRLQSDFAGGSGSGCCCPHRPARRGLGPTAEPPPPRFVANGRARVAHGECPILGGNSCTDFPARTRQDFVGGTGGRRGYQPEGALESAKGS
jgi:hypothetical protein